MVKPNAEPTVPAPVNQGELANTEEKTREEERYAAPAVDIYESGQGLMVVADLPGVSPESLSVKVENGLLTIQGKAVGMNGGDSNYLWREYRLANFWRQFQISDEIDQEKIQAEIRNGVLILTLPKADAVKPRQIQVKIG